MAHTKKQKDDLLKRAIKVAREKKLFFIEDVISHLPITKPTFYEWKFNESDQLKRILETNKIGIKLKLRKKWAASDNATLNIALYKLCATDDERKMLQEKTTIGFDDNSDNTLKVKFV